MKRYLVYSVLLLVAVSVFSSCKKDEMSLKAPELILKGDYNGVTTLNLSQNKLSISGKLVPESAVDNKISIKVTSNADTVGFEFTAKLSDGDVVDGKTRYLFKKFSENIYAANHTNATAKYIKVASTTDIIKVVVGSNIIQKTYPVNCQEVLTLTYWPSSLSGTLFLHGHTFSGSENKQVEIWTIRDPQHVPMTLVYNDPTQYQGLPSFNNFQVNLDFIDGFSSIPNSIIGINPSGDTVYIRYNSKTYFSVFNSNTFAPLVEIQ